MHDAEIDLLVGHRHGCGRDGSVDVDLARARVDNPGGHTRSRRGWSHLLRSRSSFVRHRFCCGIPRGDGCTSRWRAVWHAYPCPSSDGDRDGAHRLGHDRSASRKSRTGPRHGFRGRYDRMQRHRRCLSADGRRPPPRAGISGSRSERRSGGPRCADRSHDGSSEPRGPRTRSVVQQAAAHLRRPCVAGAVFRIRLHPDGTPPRLFSAGRDFDPGGTCRTPDNRTTVLSAVLLVVSLVAIVGLAKALTPTVERGIDYLQVPKAVVGTIIAALVLLPEAVAAIKAAQSDRLQTSLNLALGSALATIGLTIPAVAAVSIVLGYRLELGLDTKELGLLVLTLLLSVITLGTGRTTVLQGVVHLVIFAAFLFFAVVP